MKRNVIFNGLGPETTLVEDVEQENLSVETAPLKYQSKDSLGKVRVNEGDAW
jgi:hypothetical protein